MLGILDAIKRKPVSTFLGIFSNYNSFYEVKETIVTLHYLLQWIFIMPFIQIASCAYQTTSTHILDYH